MPNRTPARHRWILKVVVVLVSLMVLYTYQVPNNPAGFYIDESSIAYNAYTISQTGRDEHGIAWPLFFSAFGEYKSPVYIYLLAPLFLITGPSILTARLLSAALGLITACLLGLLAASITKRKEAGLLVALITALTPWVFELSRVALEVAMYPALTALFLLVVWRAARKTRWGLSDVVSLVVTLALLTYGYSIGRLFAPLLAAGLIAFASRERAKALFATWVGYAVTLVPAVVFQIRHPEALTNRFHYITYITPDISYSTLVFQFAKHYIANINPWRIFFWETSKVSEIIHIPRTQPMLITTALLVAFSLWIVVKYKRGDAWWRYVLYALAVSIVPASLTKESFHMLRLAPLPVLLIVISIPAIGWLFEANTARYRLLMTALVLLTLLHGAVFQYQYYASVASPIRRHVYDADYATKILDPVLARNQRPIYLADAAGIPGYIQAYWYATVRHLNVSDFVKLPPEKAAPQRGIVISTEPILPAQEVVGYTEPYVAYISPRDPRVHEPLPISGFHADILLKAKPDHFRAGQQATLSVRVRNASDTTWLGAERIRGLYQVSLGNHWLDQYGNIVTNDDGRTPLTSDLKPGEEIELPLTLTAPGKPGEYVLEIDMLQESVAWFAHKGSQPLRIPVKVE